MSPYFVAITVCFFPCPSLILTFAVLLRCRLLSLPFGYRRLRVTGRPSRTRMTCGTLTRCALAGANTPCRSITTSPVHRRPTAGPTPSPTQILTALIAAWEGQACDVEAITSAPYSRSRPFVIHPDYDRPLRSGGGLRLMLDPAPPPSIPKAISTVKANNEERGSSAVFKAGPSPSLSLTSEPCLTNERTSRKTWQKNALL